MILSLIISEYLIHRRQTLFIKARESLDIRNCWKRGGIVFIKDSNGNIHKVDSDEDLVTLCSLHNTNQPKTSDQPTSAPGQSEEGQSDYVK